MTLRPKKWGRVAAVGTRKSTWEKIPDRCRHTYVFHALGGRVHRIVIRQPGACATSSGEPTILAPTLKDCIVYSSNLLQGQQTNTLAVLFSLELRSVERVCLVVRSLFPSPCRVSTLVDQSTFLRSFRSLEPKIFMATETQALRARRKTCSKT